MSEGLLLIDLQNDYFPGGRYPLSRPETALENARRVLSAFRAHGLPVFHIQHLNPPGAAFFLTGTSGAEIHAGVAPLPTEPVLVKHAPDSFYETGLADVLQKSGVDRLTVCGMMTHMCVDTTVRAARNLGIPVTLIGDACAARALSWNGTAVPAEAVQAAYLAALNGSFAKVCTAEEFLTAFARS